MIEIAPYITEKVKVDPYERLMKAIAISAVVDVARGRKQHREEAIEFITKNPIWTAWAVGRGLSKINWLLAEYQ